MEMYDKTEYARLVWANDGIDELIEELSTFRSRLEARGVEIVGKPWVDVYESAISIGYTRKETPKEKASRLKKAERIRAEREANELAEFERLRAKYGD